MKKTLEKTLDNILDAYWFCYRFIRDGNSAWYRFFGHKHHIVKTKLTPASWYDTDTRMLYAVMSLVEWFVENDMMKWSVEERQKELDRIEKDPELYNGERECLKRQWEAEDGIVEVYKWWKNYPNRQKELKIALHTWSEYISNLQKDRNDLKEFLNMHNIMNDEQKIKEKELNGHLHHLEEKLKQEEQDMLKKAIDLREAMWS